MGDVCSGAVGGLHGSLLAAIMFGDFHNHCFQPGHCVFQERLCVLLAKEEAERACGSADGSADSRLILCTADECVCLCGGLPERVYEAGEKGNRI